MMTPKCVPASNMAPIRTISMSGLSKAAILAFRVEKPQEEQADIACVSASNQSIPVTLKSSIVAAVSPA